MAEKKTEIARYAGSIVLGLNDALIEITGALTGLTFAFQNSRMISMAGIITGFSAALSMAVSEYFSTKEEGRKDALKASLYTGAAYVITVFFLLIPFFIFKKPTTALFVMFPTAVAVLYIFNMYISSSNPAQSRRRFFQMVVISLGIALLNFFIGTLVKKYLHVEV